MSACLVGPRLFGRSWLSSHMAFSRVACVVASRLDLACLVSARRGLRGLILCCLVWSFFLFPSCLAVAVFCFASLFCLVVCFFLRSSLFCCFVSPWLELCAGQRFHLRLSFDVACASARLVRFALSFCCRHWFLSTAVSLCDSALRVPPPETRLRVHRRFEILVRLQSCTALPSAFSYLRPLCS